MTSQIQGSTINEIIENIKCFVRLRPLNEKEKSLGAGCIKINEDSTQIQVEIKVDNSKLDHKPFILDKVFGDAIHQVDVFETVGLPILKNFFQGYNCTVFAYGQTGAGKTHTMMGPLTGLFDSTKDNDNHGLIPRIVDFIFNSEKAADFIMSEGEDSIFNLRTEYKCSCFELYQEQVIDLLVANNSNDSLLVREDPKRGMYIEGLTETVIRNDLAAKELIMQGLKNRHVAATNMNSESSRSHLIFTIFLNLSYSLKDGTIQTKSSRLHLIDLAGSERQKATKAIGERIKEAGRINKSLSTLGNVINALVEMSEGKNKFVPFRDSKLTYFLKDSLGGNAKTTIIANISQSIIQCQETISTLKFIQRAKMIKNKASVIENENITVKVLQDEIKRLKDEIQVKSTEQNTTTSTVENEVGFICSRCRKRLSDISNVNVSNIDSVTIQTTLNANINILIKKIEQLFSYEVNITDRLKLIDVTNSIEKFFVNKEIFETDYKILIQTLEKKIKHFNNITEFQESMLSELKDEMKMFKTRNIADTEYILKINLFIDELKKFKTDFEINNMLSITKLSEENKLLKTDIESYKNLKDFFNKNSIKSDKELNAFYDKSNVDFFCKKINEFLDSNRDLKSFFEENLFKGEESAKDFNYSIQQITKAYGTEYTVISQKTLTKLNFQLEEYQINDDNNAKVIEDLQSENFLLNMEILKYKEKGIIVEDKLNESIDSQEEVVNKNIKNSTLSIPGSQAKASESLLTPNKSSNLIIQDVTGDDNNRLEAEIDEGFTTPNKKIEVINKDVVNKKHIVRENSRDVPYEVRTSFRDSYHSENKTQYFLVHLRKSLLDASPGDSLLKKALQYSKNAYNRTSTFKGMDHGNNSIADDNESAAYDRNSTFLNKDNLELLKIKEKYDDALLNLDEKNEEINQKNQKIEELQTFLDNYQKDREELESIISNLREDLDTLSESNAMLLYDLTNQCEKTRMIEQIQNENFKEIYDLLNNSNSMVNDLNATFSRYYNHIEQIQNVIVNNSNHYQNTVKKYLNKNKDNNSDRLERDIQILEEQLKILKERDEMLSEENYRYRERIREIFGDINIDIFLSKTAMKIDKKSVITLEKRINELEEIKKMLTIDITLLRSDFSRSLSDSSLNHKIQLLMKVKEENYKLKLELIELKKKNEFLEREIQMLGDEQIKKEINEVNLNFPEANSLNFNNVNNININHHTHIVNMEESIKIKREHTELCDKVIELDKLHKVREKIKFKRSMEILKQVQEWLEFNKFYVDAKFKKSETETIISVTAQEISSCSSNITINSVNTTPVKQSYRSPMKNITVDVKSKNTSSKINVNITPTKVGSNANSSNKIVTTVKETAKPKIVNRSTSNK